MKNLKLITFLFLGIILIGLVNGLDNSQIKFYGKPNQNLTIYEKCIDNGFNCNSNFNCNITVVETLTQEIIILNQPMLRDQTVYNYTLNSTQTSKISIYEDTVTCNNQTNAGTSTFYHQINTAGSPPIGNGEGFALIGVILTLIFVIIIMFSLGILSKNIPASLFFICFGVLLLVGTVGFGFTVMEQLFGLYSTIISGYGLFYRLLVILVTGMSILLMLYLFVVAFKSLQIKRGLRDE